MYLAFSEVLIYTNIQMENNVFDNFYLNVLILNEEPNLTDNLYCYLKKQKINVYKSYNYSSAFEILNNNKIDLLLLDTKLPGNDGMEILKRIKKDYSSIEVILLSEDSNIDTIIDALRLGAVDFIQKPFKLPQIKTAIERTNKYINLSHRLEQFQSQYSNISKEFKSLTKVDIIFNEKSIMKKIFEMAFQAGKYDDTNVFISGESGTGKEIISHAIHHSSDRASFPFIAVNCSAIPEELIENEFFGHEKGAFTGADYKSIGYFELANKGTLFLDEITEMPLNIQSKLLRAIEEKKIIKVGSNIETDTDVRIIAATNQNIHTLIDHNEFRLDLFHRINAMEINIPPLRERPEDIETLARYFIDKYSVQFNKSNLKVSNSLIKQLKAYSFPGNVRELKNMIERAVILFNNDIFDEKYFQLESLSSSEFTGRLNLKENEIKLIKSAFKETHNNQVKAAKLLGISRDALIRKMKKYNLLMEKQLNN